MSILNTCYDYIVPRSFEDVAFAVHAYMTAQDDPDQTTFHQVTEKQFALLMLGLRMIMVHTEKPQLIEDARLLEEKLLDAARLQRGGALTA